MNSGEKNARIVCRMKSVDATRLIPSRCATSTATVDFPVPVEPPIITIIGTSSCCRSDSRRSRSTARSPCVSPSTSRASTSSRSSVAADSPRLGEVDLDPPREPVRLVGRDAGGDQRPRHQPLRVRQLRRRRAAAARQWRGCDIRRPPPAPARAAPRRSTPTTSFAGEHDADAARERVRRDDVDAGRLHLDEIRVRIDEIVAQRARGSTSSPRRARRRRRDARRRSRPR